LVQFYVQKIHESELLFLVVRLTFLERLHINHIARNDIWDKITLPSGAFATDTPLHQHQGLLFDERQLCLLKRRNENAQTQFDNFLLSR
jgi:hypothetical protein